jgi:hypothetical protein
VKTLLKFDINETRLCKFLFTQREILTQPDSSNLDGVRLIKLSDGIVYYFNGVYSFGDLKNQINHIIITGLDKGGIIYLDTKTIAKKGNKLVGELLLYLETINAIIVNLSNYHKISIEFYESHSLNDMREQIIIDNTK